MKRVTRILLTAAVAFGAVSGPVAAARADDTTLRSTIVAQDRLLVPGRALTRYGGEKKITARQLPAALKVIRAYEPRLERAARAVARVTPSTARGRAGQRAWVDGVRQIALEYRDIAAELRALEQGRHATATRDLHRALTALGRGKKLLARADRLLQLPQGT
jgi:hypothetical protein